MSGGYPNPSETAPFWRDAFDWARAVTRRILWEIAVAGAFAVAVTALYSFWPWGMVQASPIEYTGGVLVLLLVLRSNASYDRWWEGRKLWGGIVNQTRNLAALASAHAPDADWSRDLARWTAVFPHACKQSLRGVRDLREIEPLVGERARAVERAQHMPLYVAEVLERSIARGRELGLDPYVVIAMQNERGRLMDHLGGCERILRTPMPRLHTIMLRRFLLLYLMALPIVVAGDVGWLTPLVTVLVAYPLFAIDRVAQELERPFDAARLSHLPLDSICATIDQNLLALPLAGDDRSREAPVSQAAQLQ